MELLLIVQILMRRWILIVIPVAVAAIFSVPALLRNEAPAAGGFNMSLRYTASHEMEARTYSNRSLQDVWNASELLVNLLADWVRSASFRQAVSAQLAADGLTIPPDSFSFAADNQRSVGSIYLSRGSEDELRSITEAALVTLATRSAEFIPQLAGVPAQIVILDEPRISPAAAALPSRLRPLLQLGVALIAGIGLAFLIEYLDPTLRGRAELQQIGLPVIGAIPRD